MVSGSSPRKIAVVYYPPLWSLAEGEMVAAWTMQVLTEKHDIILWTERTPDFCRLDARFGTTLARRPPTVVTLSGWQAWRLRRWPARVRSRLLKTAFVEDPRQRYLTAEDGGRALHAVWASPALQSELHEAARPRGLQFSCEVFCKALREEIAAMA